jgi:hypothetical protein
MLALSAVGGGLVAPTFTQAGGPDLPAYAKPGQCYGRVTLPAVYHTVTTKELVKAGGRTVKTISPAVVQTTRQRVLVKPARTVKVRGPGVYRTVVKEIVVPGRSYWKIEPAAYRTVEEKVLVEPAHAAWVPQSKALAYGGALPGQTLLQATGEVYCRVMIPARYEVRVRKVEVSPERKIEIIEPSKVKRVKKRVLVKAGPLVAKTLPPVYRDVVTRKVIRPATKQVTETKAVYRTVTRKEVVREEAQGWAQVFCGGQISAEFLFKVQSALVARGYEVGPVDGIDRPQMWHALGRFQADRHIARGQLTIETGRALGVY